MWRLSSSQEPAGNLFLVEAITTVAGNVSLERTTANACTILDVLEQNVPVIFTAML
jgi:inosine-uridine nucleoside N-ribohydrolase